MWKSRPVIMQLGVISKVRAFGLDLDVILRPCHVRISCIDRYRCRVERGFHTHAHASLNMAASTQQTRGGNFRLFEGSSHSEVYARYRPTYPPEVYDAILKYCKKSPDFTFDFAVDVACGTGQSTEPLADHFKRVLGTDVSPSQVEQAKRKAKKRQSDSKVDYAVGRAEDLGDHVAPSSVDLITCAQSFHWFDQDKVQAVACRALKSAGVLAVYGYGNCQLSLNSASQIIEKFFSETVGKYWPPERKLVNSRFSGRRLKLKEFSRIDDLEIHRQMPLSAFIGYLSSWSAYQAMLKDQPGSLALQDVEQELIEEYNQYKETRTEEGEIMLDVTWPIFILLGRNQ